MKGLVMNNIKELMKTVDNKKYTKKEKKKIINRCRKVLGDSVYLSICMEEIAELINVISDSIDGNMDYIHITEELVDTMYAKDILINICNIPHNKINKIKKRKEIKKSVAVTTIRDLSKAQQNISKYARHKNDGYDKVVSAVNIMNEAIINVQSLYRIKKSDISKIETLKYMRNEERLANGTLK